MTTLIYLSITKICEFEKYFIIHLYYFPVLFPMIAFTNFVVYFLFKFNCNCNAFRVVVFLTIIIHKI